MMPLFFLVLTMGRLSWLAAATALPALPLDIRDELHVDPYTTAIYATDYGRLTNATPAAVLTPSSPEAIAAFLRLNYLASRPLTVAARGHGYSVRGQSTAAGGVVIDMGSLRSAPGRINVSATYVDAGAEQPWIAVLLATLERGLTPRVLVDYLHLTVGGTLSYAGVSGQAFLYGPQIANVDELDVVTAKGELVTCSREVNSDLFYGALGGLGQFGVITRARIGLDPAPKRVRRVKLFYTDFAALTRDQQLLISMTSGEGFNYVEGVVLLANKGVGNSTFFSSADAAKINKLATQSNPIYYLGAALYYDSPSIVDQKMEALLRQLSFLPGFNFSKDVAYVDFAYRTPELVDVAFHPWLNMLVPGSRIRDFDLGVFKGILKNTDPAGPMLVYPHNKNKWVDKMSVATPDEDIFYTVSMLRSALADDWMFADSQNEAIMEFCEREGIRFKAYLPHYATREAWAKHFGPAKWKKFVQLKRKYDPRALLAPGQRIFNAM